METTLNRLITLCLCIGFALCSNGQNKYRMTFPDPILQPDTDYPLYGYYNLDDTDGSFLLVINYQYKDARPFNKYTGLACVETMDGKWGFIDKTNHPQGGFYYDESADFNEYGRAIVKINGKYGVVSSNGISIIPCAYDSMDDLHNGWYEVSRDGDWQYLHWSNIAVDSYSEYQKRINEVEEATHIIAKDN